MKFSKMFQIGHKIYFLWSKFQNLKMNQWHVAFCTTSTSHLGKMIINPNWWNQFWWNLWCWIRDILGYQCKNFYTQRSINFIYIIEIVTWISTEEIGKLGLSIPGASLHCFQKRSALESSIWRDIFSYTIRSEIFQVLKIRVSLTNPRSDSSGSRTDTSNR